MLIEKLDKLAWKLYSEFGFTTCSVEEQEIILKEFITSVNSTTRLRNLINEEIKKISEKVNKLVPLVKDDVVKIKLEEVAKNIVPISKKEKILFETKKNSKNKSLITLSHQMI